MTQFFKDYFSAIVQVLAQTFIIAVWLSFPVGVIAVGVIIVQELK